jgi:hypothetical protein
MIGINLSGAEFGVKHVYGKDYYIPGRSEVNYYADRGVKLIRLPIMWERMQSSLGGQLNSADVALVKQFLADAHARSVDVILDLHNYGRYDGKTIGSADGPTNAQFADFWNKLALEVKDLPALAGYGLMNEPHDMGGAGIWKSAAQAAVDAIRKVDATQAIYANGDGWSGAWSWKEINTDFILSDPANNIIYEAHQYFDRDSSGTYNGTYDQEGAHPNVGVDRLKPFFAWLKENNLKGFIGEFGVPSNDPRWLEVQERALSFMKENGVGGTAWGGGFWWPSSYSMFMGKPGVPDTEFFKALQPYMESWGSPLGTQTLDATIYGTLGADHVNGTGADDKIDARGGDDILHGSAGSDHMDGGAGMDTVNYSASPAGVNVDLLRASQSGGDAQEDVLANIERVTGSDFADLLFGDGGANLLSGLAGDDVLNGRGGADVLTGGPGNDRFVFDSAANADGDLITDWGAGDFVDLSGIDANALLEGKQGFLLIDARAFSRTAGELRFYNDGTNSFISGDVNGDGVADFTITVKGIHDFIAGVSPALERFHYAGADWC